MHSNWNSNEWGLSQAQRIRTQIQLINIEIIGINTFDLRLIKKIVRYSLDSLEYDNFASSKLVCSDLPWKKIGWVIAKTDYSHPTKLITFRQSISYINRLLAIRLSTVWIVWLQSITNRFMSEIYHLAINRLLAQSLFFTRDKHPIPKHSKNIKQFFSYFIVSINKVLFIQMSNVHQNCLNSSKLKFPKSLHRTIGFFSEIVTNDWLATVSRVVVKQSNLENVILSISFNCSKTKTKKII